MTGSRSSSPISDSLINDSHTIFFSHYPIARALNRKHQLYLGPTNSGKTHQALLALMAATSGLYLAPLRLLAMEVRDKLLEYGIPCNLLTGEERVLIPGARHTAATVEMMPRHNPVEVAVIDEIQMLQDPDRGYAWTEALLGVPAPIVYICGSTAVTHLVTPVLEAMREEYQITYLDRKTPLMLEESSLCGHRYSKPKLKKALQKGDAVIAFSRKDVLTLAARARQWGFSVATIYGALAPEVRRYESERFHRGEADILIATDAIGMGLNLPIRRIIFANIYKFDGIASRPLNATEVKQIAGRAGRYGQYPTGFINVMEDGERLHIEDMLARDDRALIEKLPIAPSFDQIAEISQQFFTHKLEECISYLNTRMRMSHPLFNLHHSSAVMAQAQLVDRFAPHMHLRDKFIFACAPISIQVPIERDYFIQCLQSVYLDQPRRLPDLPRWMASANGQYLEQAEIMSQNLSLYAWLSYKFPNIFVDRQQISDLRTKLAAYITQALETQPGYGEIAREQDSNIRRRY